MKPKAYIYSPSESIRQSLEKALASNNIKSTDNITSEVPPYIFAIVFTASDLNILKKSLNNESKKVIALPISLKSSLDLSKFTNLKLIFFSELVTNKVSHKYGYANWIIENLKANSKIFLPEDDIEIHPLYIEELVNLMLKEGFSYFKSSQVFVSHNASVKRFAEWLRKVDSNLLVSVDKNIKLQELKLDLSEIDIKVIPLTGQTLSKMYLGSTVKEKVKKTKKSFTPKLKFPKRLILLSLTVILMPFILFFVSLASLYFGNLNLTEAINQTNLTIVSPFGDNDLKRGIVASQNAVKLARQAADDQSINFDSLEALESASEDYQALYKELSFYKLDPNNTNGFFSKLVSSVPFDTLDEKQIITLSRFSQIASQLLGEKKEINYLFVEIKDSFADKAAVVTVEDSLVREASVFSDNYIDDRMLGIVEAPSDYLEYSNEEGFKFRLINWQSDLSKRATLASWFIEKSLSQKVDVVVFTDQDISLIVDNLQKGNIFENKELLLSFYNDLNSQNAFVWSSREELNSVFIAQGYVNQVKELQNIFYPYYFPLERNSSVKQKGEYTVTTDADSYSVNYAHRLSNQSDKDTRVYQRFILARNIVYKDFKVNGKEVKPEFVQLEDYQELGFVVDIKKGESSEISFAWSFLPSHPVNIFKQEFEDNLELHLTLDGNSLYNTNLVQGYLEYLK